MIELKSLSDVALFKHQWIFAKFSHELDIWMTFNLILGFGIWMGYVILLRWSYFTNIKTYEWKSKAKTAATDKIRVFVTKQFLPQHPIIELLEMDKKQVW